MMNLLIAVLNQRISDQSERALVALPDLYPPMSISYF
jgi:hypothetical protein